MQPFSEWVHGYPPTENAMTRQPKEERPSDVYSCLFRAGKASFLELLKSGVALKNDSGIQSCC